MTRIIQQALISVSDKTGIVEFARALRAQNIALLSTGGTAKALQDQGVPATEISQYTGSPEMLDGRVKTLHPKVHGGILARRDVPEDLAALSAQDIPLIDLVIVNLYPFRSTIADPRCSLADAIENIDIGGPAMVRSAAKNYRHVAVIVDPADYSVVLDELTRSGQSLSESTRFRLAQKAFSHTAAYDAAISNYLTARDAEGAPIDFPQQFNYTGAKVQDLRYGENPHQLAAFYRDEFSAGNGITGFVQRQGKELSYNNIADSDAAWECVQTLSRGERLDAEASASRSVCVIVKHANPCGAALAASPLEAYRKALATDPTSAFGGIIAFNVEVDAATMEAVGAQFVEVLLAPSYSASAITGIAKKPNVRVLELSLQPEGESTQLDFKRVDGGLLVQTRDTRIVYANELSVVSKRAPSAAELTDLLFAWRVAKHVKSNAIVFCGGEQTLGIGAGQMSRVDSTRIAAIKAQNAGLSLRNSAVASDAFFPFRDGLDVVAENGATSIIQPGGSMRDAEVIAAADEHGMAMVFTGVRHFRH